MTGAAAGAATPALSEGCALLLLLGPPVCLHFLPDPPGILIRGLVLICPPVPAPIAAKEMRKGAWLVLEQPGSGSLAWQRQRAALPVRGGERQAAGREQLGSGMRRASLTLPTRPLLPPPLRRSAHQPACAAAVGSGGSRTAMLRPTRCIRSIRNSASPPVDASGMWRQQQPQGASLACHHSSVPGEGLRCCSSSACCCTSCWKDCIQG